MGRKVIVATLAALSLGVTAIASAQTNDRPAPSWDGMGGGEFTARCKSLGGGTVYTFPGQLSCVLPDGSRITCDLRGGTVTQCKRVERPSSLPGPAGQASRVADRAQLLGG